MVLYLCSPIPITFENPQQLQSYPRLGMHLSSSCHVFTPSVRLGSARCGSGSCRGVHSLLLCRVLMPFPGIAEHRQPEPCPLAPEVARVICEVLASSPPRGVPENRSFLSDFHLARLLLLLRKCAACDPFLFLREEDIILFRCSLVSVLHAAKVCCSHPIACSRCSLLLVACLCFSIHTLHVPAATSRTVCSLVATCLLTCVLVCSGRLLSFQSGKMHPITGMCLRGSVAYVFF